VAFIAYNNLPFIAKNVMDKYVFVKFNIIFEYLKAARIVHIVQA
jgi:hypothetical protein